MTDRWNPHVCAADIKCCYKVDILPDSISSSCQHPERAPVLSHSKCPMQLLQRSLKQFLTILQFFSLALPAAASNSWTSTRSSTTAWVTKPSPAFCLKSTSSTMTTGACLRSPDLFWIKSPRRGSGVWPLWPSAITAPLCTSTSWPSWLTSLVTSGSLGQCLTRGQAPLSSPTSQGQRDRLRGECSWHWHTSASTAPMVWVCGRTSSWWPGRWGGWPGTPACPGAATGWSTRTPAPGPCSSSTPRPTSWSPTSGWTLWWARTWSGGGRSPGGSGTPTMWPHSRSIRTSIERRSRCSWRAVMGRPQDRRTVESNLESLKWLLDCLKRTRNWRLILSTFSPWLTQTRNPQSLHSYLLCLQLVNCLIWLSVISNHWVIKKIKTRPGQDKQIITVCSFSAVHSENVSFERSASAGRPRCVKKIVQFVQNSYFGSRSGGSGPRSVTGAAQ